MADWPAANARLAKAAASPSGGMPLASTKLLAPILWPSAIYCAGANYADHAAEMARASGRPPEPDPHTLGLKPWHFLKAGRSTLAAPDDTVRITGLSKTMDWEIELAAVIGRAAKNVPLDKAARLRCRLHHRERPVGTRHGATARTCRTPRRSSSIGLAHKNFDGSWPARAVDRAQPGPFPDPQKLGLKLWVNDVIKQIPTPAR